MSSEVGEPPLDPSHADATQPPKKPGDSPEPVAPDAPSEVLPAYSSSSGDELNALLSGPASVIQPDPFLGEFSSGEATAAPAGTPPSQSFDAVSALLAFTDPTPVEPVAGPAQSEPAAVLEHAGGTSSDPSSISAADVSDSPLPASSDTFPAIDLSAPSSTRDTPARRDVPDEAEDEDGDLPPPRTSWATLLLFSYASAVTLGLVWVLLTGRKVRERVEVEPVPAVDTRPDPGVRADRSRKVTPPPPLPADHVTALGKALRLGSLEATPLQITPGGVSLRRAVGDLATRDGGSGALRLRLRLKNLSTDAIFAPLDEAFLREREPGTLDSFIELGPGGEVGMYPLAVSSEWTINGQEFRELRPGQSFETDVVSASDVGDRLAPEMTWRIRLRTGINQTDTMGVRFRKEEVKSAE